MATAKGLRLKVVFKGLYWGIYVSRSVRIKKYGKEIISMRLLSFCMFMCEFSLQKEAFQQLIRTLEFPNSKHPL